jgi:glucosamine-6-phosphate deaminase
MKIIQAKDYRDLGQKASTIIINLVRQNPRAVLGLATGSTPKTTYKDLINDHHNNGTTYCDIQTVNLDEYVGLAKNDPNSYHYFMDEQLFRHIDIQSENTFIPNGSAADIEKECSRYDQLIKSIGGVDLQLLGIGRNGHIGFNEPGTSFDEKTHVVKLAEDTRIANARFFNDDIDAVPKQAITMGIQNILESKSILLLASGKGKAKALARLLNDRDVSESFPASSLHLHPNVTLIADEEALSTVYSLEGRP